jgi:hypothetical protein
MTFALYNFSEKEAVKLIPKIRAVAKFLVIAIKRKSK